jgi:dTDP-4-dehydrorhamnose 3,5-epimerase
MLPGLKLLTPRVFADERGHFFESWSESRFRDDVGDAAWVQDNESMSVRGTLRGLHYQKEPHAQAKLVRVVVGRVWDVAVDIRPGSATYGKWEAVELSGENKHQLYIPKGFAHGFLVLSDHAIFQYKVDAPWNRESEACIRWNDPTLAIGWPLPESELIISEKDRMGRELRVVSSEL